ncbi:iojap-like protein [Desulfotomaculum nigrificans CO-1-SRB]|uniref:Ribosomal silencing factor RsfS n=1 Tax=Desulfotomaculum nigrificans (strain DSM 14880 / VKM B-2319 / CO-1-SRB) TaxID=868595 RepID=F6B8Q1_DESCC|nr:ribosome silencing factor [Desulfotomaculum nigrificans]AEF94744.1 iojap-like protein [Desulfotomaculum nigrificans CO-1-SRB]
MALSPKEIVDIAHQAADDKKAKDITVLDISHISIICDYFLICTGGSRTQVQSVAEHIEEKLEEAGVKPLRKEGFREGTWILLDYGDVVVHVFQEMERDFYNLERLWGDAQVVEISAKA